jgi:ATP-dependent Clp protease ATP-binding subunit ClpB
VEKDAAFERRFQPIHVTEPSVEVRPLTSFFFFSKSCSLVRFIVCFLSSYSKDTVSILRGLKKKYEEHHGVQVLDAAIVAAAQLSNRYITNRCVPYVFVSLFVSFVLFC